MNWRTLHDIEAAKRDNFRPETMRAFEAAYMLAPGSLDRALTGGDLEPLPPPPRLAIAPNLPPAGRLAEWLTSLPDADIERVVAHDPLLRQVWDLQDGTGKPADRAQRIAMLVVVLTPTDPMAMVAERREGSAGLDPESPQLAEIVKISSPAAAKARKWLTSEKSPATGMAPGRSAPRPLTEEQTQRPPAPWREEGGNTE
jgi:hypothetical protein